jgi:N-acetylmuramidase/Putative peptidoglycan binding domain
MDFAEDGLPLSEAGMTAVRDLLGGVEPEALWACLRVETSGCGFLRDRRPAILFERHVFHRETGGRFDVSAPDVSDATAGGYGAGGVHQYDRLAAAIALDRRAALRSASWGIGQVMGFHAESLGFADVEAMVAALVTSEDAQLRAMAAFIKSSGLDGAMRRRDWTAFARGYNGADFAENAYDKKLEREHAQLVARGLPDLRVRSAQLYLTYRGLDPGPVDGRMGERTGKALREFQATAGLAVTGLADDPTLARLAAPE